MAAIWRFYFALRTRGFGRDVSSTRLDHNPRLGASGAIAGILGAKHAPVSTARVVVVVPILFMPASRSLLLCLYRFWFLLQIPSLWRNSLQPILQRRRRVGGHMRGFIAGFITWPRSLSDPSSVYRVYYPDEGGVGLRQRGRHEAFPFRRFMSIVIFSVILHVSRRSSQCCARMLEQCGAQDFATRTGEKIAGDSDGCTGETCGLLVFPNARYIDITNSEEVCAPSKWTDADVPVEPRALTRRVSCACGAANREGGP